MPYFSQTQIPPWMQQVDPMDSYLKGVRGATEANESRARIANEGFMRKIQLLNAGVNYSNAQANLARVGWEAEDRVRMNERDILWRMKQGRDKEAVNAMLSVDNQLSAQAMWGTDNAEKVMAVFLQEHPDMRDTTMYDIWQKRQASARAARLQEEKVDASLAASREAAALQAQRYEATTGKLKQDLEQAQTEHGRQRAVLEEKIRKLQEGPINKPLTDHEKGQLAAEIVGKSQKPITFAEALAQVNEGFAAQTGPRKGTAPPLPPGKTAKDLPVLKSAAEKRSFKGGHFVDEYGRINYKEPLDVAPTRVAPAAPEQGVEPEPAAPGLGSKLKTALGNVAEHYKEEATQELSKAKDKLSDIAKEEIARKVAKLAKDFFGRKGDKK